MATYTPEQIQAFKNAGAAAQARASVYGVPGSGFTGGTVTATPYAKGVPLSQPGLSGLDSAATRAPQWAIELEKQRVAEENRRQFVEVAAIGVGLLTIGLAAPVIVPAIAHAATATAGVVGAGATAADKLNQQLDQVKKDAAAITAPMISSNIPPKTVRATQPATPTVDQGVQTTTPQPLAEDMYYGPPAPNNAKAVAGVGVGIGIAVLIVAILVLR